MDMHPSIPQPIPQPKKRPLLGNLRELDQDSPIQSLMRLAREFGPIFRLDLPGRSPIFVSSRELVHELCDEERFDKRVHAPLQEIRAFAGDGLFTARTDETNWGKAHRILMPAFGPIGLRGMFGQMLEVAEQMLLRWERFGENAIIDVPDQMTRLTLDTIALCAFDYRFNSFYQNEMHPFVGAMVDGLKEAGARTRRPDFATRLMLRRSRRYAADIRLMHEVADRLISERRADAQGEKKKDLLGLMLDAKDPVTGEGLSDENIRYQMVTFLIAGHETTSGLLSFAIHLLLKNPEVQQKARTLVDGTFGNETPRVEHLAQLRYIEQILMETLRLWPTAPAFALSPRQDTLLGGRYAVTAKDTILVIVPMLHRDPEAWGPDVEAFRPERFDREAEAKLPPNAWKPFGNGQRSCIGRPFAMQEAMLVLSMILQRFDLIPEHAGYELKVKETLTLKPEGFRIHVRRRVGAGLSPQGLPQGAAQKPPQHIPKHAAQPVTLAGSGAAAGPLTPLLVLYGSNTGSSQAFAQRIGMGAPAHGYAATVAALDDHAGRLPKAGAVVIVTASYEGQPPDNARRFVAELRESRAGDLAGVRFAVFGCGNRQWARTYQAIPTMIDGRMEAAGASRLLARGEADGSGDFFGAFETWYADLWPALASAFGKPAGEKTDAPQLQVEVVTESRSAILRQDDLATGRLAENRELVDMASARARSKRHFEIALPEGMTYRTGDYLAVLPRNAPVNVERALRRFGFAADSRIILHKSVSGPTFLPTETPISAGELLSDYVELGQPATRPQVAALAASTRCPPEKKPLEECARAENYQAGVLGKRLSVLDLLERYASCELGFAAFLQMLPPLKARQYSISSSPLWDGKRCTLTVAIVDAPALSGQGRFLGVASHFLANLPTGSRIPVAVRSGNPRFRPPEDPRVPMILICAGTGIAPFRGFLQERAILALAGKEVGPTLLFFGCAHAEVDFLYRQELADWQREGVVDVRPAFSQAPEADMKYVQHRLWKDRAEVEDLFRKGATVYLCGDGLHMAPAVRETLIRMYREAKGVAQTEAEQWAERMEREHGRYVEDIFA